LVAVGNGDQGQGGGKRTEPQEPYIDEYCHILP